MACKNNIIMHIQQIKYTHTNKKDDLQPIVYSQIHNTS